jgi:hypothetical protein
VNASTLAKDRFFSKSRRLWYWADRVRISIAQRGIAGTARRALLYGRLYLTPAGWRERQFDSRFGVQTSGHIGQYDLGINVPNVLYSGEYRPTPVQDFLCIIEGLRIDHSKWVFVDLGAGMGRAVLLACQFPFYKVTGVELSSDLARIACENIARYRNSGQKCSTVGVVCEDAADFRLPSEKTIIFLNNPFRGPVMERVLDNIERSLQAWPRDVYVVYWNPFCANLLDEAPFLEKIRGGAQYCLYKSKTLK